MVCGFRSVQYGVDGRGREPVKSVGYGFQNRPERVRAAGGPERHRLPERNQRDAGPKSDVLYIRVGVPVHVLDTGNSGGLRRSHHAHDRRGRGQHAGHHRHRDREGAEERAELVHRQPGRGRLLPGHHRHAVLVGQRADGLLDIRRLVVRHTRRPGRAPVHCVHHEPVSDSPGQILVNYTGRCLLEETHARPGRGHDLLRVDIQWRYLHTTSARLEGQESARTIPQMPGKRRSATIVIYRYYTLT